MPQHLLLEDNRTVFEEAAQAFAEINGMEARINEINHQLETRTDYESDKTVYKFQKEATFKSF